MSRYTRREFNLAYLEPQSCDGTAFPGHDGDAPYWFACTYHSGYMDGIEDSMSRDAGQRPLLLKQLSEDDLQEFERAAEELRTTPHAVGSGAQRCSHHRQIWRIDMASGHCRDCGAPLPDVSVNANTVQVSGNDGAIEVASWTHYDGVGGFRG